MLTKLIIENYKSIEKAELEFSKMNLLIGPNGSGKSSVLEAFGLLSWKLIPFTDGEFTQVVHNHETTRKILVDGMFEDMPFSRITYEVPPFGSRRIIGKDHSAEFLYVLTSMRKLQRTLSGVKSSPSGITSKDAHQLFYYACYRKEFEENVRIIREFYSRYGLHDVRWVPTERQNEYEIIATTPEGVDINLADAGAGLAALFPIVVALAFYPEGSTVFIEHPEMHLHPKLQYELAEFFRRVSEKRNYQLIIETHSEHLLYGLLNAVAQKRLKLGELTVYSARKENGKSLFEKMAVHEDGSLEGNLSDFLEADVDAFLDWLKA
ncbi:AAA family ATPase [Thermococcus sp.]|uniref:AAA family ATPase n=1 Tax=Thermococcus sp. TaxID=35749 RepID=UPI0026085148|nr:AAA family ATPase [Thermococcus sp.]